MHASHKPAPVQRHLFYDANIKTLFYSGKYFTNF